MEVGLRMTLDLDLEPRSLCSDIIGFAMRLVTGKAIPEVSLQLSPDLGLKM